MSKYKSRGQGRSASSFMDDDNNIMSFNTKFPMPSANTYSYDVKNNATGDRNSNTNYRYTESFNKNSRSSSSSSTSTASGKHHYRALASSGLVFRSADRTQRAVKELAQKRYEATQRKKAGALMFILLILAFSVFYITNTSSIIEVDTNNNNNNMQSAASTNGTVVLDADPMIEFAAGITGDENGGNAPGLVGGGNAVDEEPPEEEVIEDGKEFLQPYRYFADLTTQSRNSDTNFFFHIPRCGGQTVKDIAGRCLKRTLASEVGVREGHAEDQELKVINIKDSNYVNVDTTSVDGLHRAAALGLASSGLTDMISSSYFAEVGMLFELQHKGRAFTMMRDPMERAISMYYYRTQGDNPIIDPSITLEDYAQGNGIENNWVTRFLTGRMEGELTKDDLENAKEILSRKFLVGILEDGEETIYRLMKYFNWSFDPDDTKQMEQEDCIMALLKEGTNKNPKAYEMPQKGSQAAALFKWQTQFDIKLYEYALELFDAQTKEYGSKDRKKLLKKKKKEGGK